ncbi:pseudaminic acid synthase [Pontibacterium sp.]|uniref:pseudaminic acid synthase n=1 Tax=Pontibacterium sp. TaxID=2036026 RepID=UPI00351916EA
MSFRIGSRQVGPTQPPYVIAELSANHGGSLQQALDTVSAAKAAGADAIKIQTYLPETLTIDCDKPDFLVNDGLWKGCTLFSLYQKAFTPYEWHEAIFRHARDIGITCFSTPFDESAVDMLEDLGVPAYKIASFEITDLPLLRYIAKTKKPVILSTGMATVSEIEEAVVTLEEAGCKELVILHCISGYPTPIEEANLNTIPDLATRFGYPVGLSDHTLGISAGLGAVALGACVIEKHFKLSGEDSGPDSSFSIVPEQLRLLCDSVSEVWRAKGNVNYSLKESERLGVKFRRSMYFVQDIKAGELITAKNMRRIRPGYGLPPKHYDEIIGKRAASDISRGTPVSWDLVEVK